MFAQLKRRQVYKSYRRPNQSSKRLVTCLPWLIQEESFHLGYLLQCCANQTSQLAAAAAKQIFAFAFLLSIIFLGKANCFLSPAVARQSFIDVKQKTGSHEKCKSWRRPSAYTQTWLSITIKSRQLRLTFRLEATAAKQTTKQDVLVFCQKESARTALG